MVLWNPALRALGLENVPIDLVAGQRSMAPLAAVVRRLSSEICSFRGKRSGDRRNARRQDVRSAPDRRQGVNGWLPRPLTCAGRRQKVPRLGRREVNDPFIRLDPGPIQKRADLARMSDGLEVTKGVPEEDTRSQGKDQRRGATPDRPGSRDNQETGRLQTPPRESEKI